MYVYDVACGFKGYWNVIKPAVSQSVSLINRMHLIYDCGLALLAQSTYQVKVQQQKTKHNKTKPNQKTNNNKKRKTFVFCFLLVSHTRSCSVLSESR